MSYNELLRGLRVHGRRALSLALVAAPLMFGAGCAGEVEEDDIGATSDEVRFEPPAVWSRVNGEVRHLTAQESLGMRFDAFPKVRGWEGIVENFETPGQKVHLFNPAQIDGHLAYTQTVLGRGAGYKQLDFELQIQFPADRKYMPFQVYDFRVHPIKRNGKSYRWVLNVRRYNYRDNEASLVSFLVNLKDVLSRRMMAGFGEPLLHVYDGDFRFASTGTPRRPHVTELGQIKARGIEVITEAELIAAAADD